MSYVRRPGALSGPLLLAPDLFFLLGTGKRSHQSTSGRRRPAEYGAMARRDSVASSVRTLRPLPIYAARRSALTAYCRIPPDSSHEESMEAVVASIRLLVCVVA